MEEFNLQIGPQHPALKEPEAFRFKVEGEVITDIDVRLGYSHRGIEKAAEERTYIQDLYLIERICGICSDTHVTTYVQAVEAIQGLEVPRRGQYIRMIVLELERIHSHVLWLGVAGHEVGFDTLLMYAWRDREVVQDILEALTGNRVNYAINTIGGVRRDFTPEQVADVLSKLDLLRERMNLYLDVSTQESTLIGRLAGVGKMTTEQALKFCTLGPVARASNVDIDIRRDDPYAAYSEVPFKVITSDACDLVGRVLVRMGEIFESINIIEFCLKNMPDGPIAVRAPRRIKEGHATARVEGPRGEDIHFVMSDGSDHPYRIKVRAPTMSNIPAIVETLKGSYIADIPIVVAGIDPCFSCTDRTILIDDGNREKRFSWKELREYGKRWYREHR
jgi:membrane-bound hydrogenase subunit alpha